MANEHTNYSVSYRINVDATDGAKQLENFANSVGKLVGFKTDTNKIVENINAMMKGIDSALRKNGRKKDFAYKLDINTTQTEAKLERVKTMLTEISTMTKGINMVINAGKPLNSKGIKKAYRNQFTEEKKLVTDSVMSVRNAQNLITKSIGKINAGLVSLEKERKININTADAETKTSRLLGLLKQVQTTATSRMLVNMSIPGLMAARKPIYPYAPPGMGAYVLSPAQSAKLQGKLFYNHELHQQKMGFADQAAMLKMQQKQMQKAQQRATSGANKMAAKIPAMEESAYMGRRRAAINRLQYSKAPSLRDLPLGYMLNAYMAFSLIKSEVRNAVEYSNIMETANSILKVADTDLTTFEDRFDRMAQYVRRIGVETKFTAIEVAGAVKFLSMAGMNIDTIQKSIRPITNLALIGDNDIAQIADLATNIMAGYDINSNSMNSVADILSSTVSRSNVNIIEMAESYKMAAGYLKLSGVDFAESSAAIGILGNMGVKGTMAGTALRAMATRFAKPTKEAKGTLSRLGVKFTENRDVYGKEVEYLRPLADIFGELKRKGASLQDMQTIFGKIAGNAAMMFLENSDKLRQLTMQNLSSQGLSSELAKVKQETTKGTWFQMTSMFSESFMQGYELLEPRIKGVMKDFIEKFDTKEFARGLRTIGDALLDIMTVLGNIATFFIRNFNWIEPLLFTGIVATRVFKLAGAITNLGIALGFLGKQSLASSAMSSLAGIVGLTGLIGKGGAMSFANKRALVEAAQKAGVSGKGALTKQLFQAGLIGGFSRMSLTGGTTGLFSSTVATGGGIVGAGSSIAGLGGGALAATGAFSILAGAIGYAAYKTWKLKEAKDAVQEEIDDSRKYRYKSIEDLESALYDAYKQAKKTKDAVDELTSGKTLSEASGISDKMFSESWWTKGLRAWGQANSGNSQMRADLDADDVTQSTIIKAITRMAEKGTQKTIEAGYAELSNLQTPAEVKGFMQTLQDEFGIGDNQLDPKLFTSKDGKIIYDKGLLDMDESVASKTKHYQSYIDSVAIPQIRLGAQKYYDAISNQDSALSIVNTVTKGTFTDYMSSHGFEINKNGIYQQVIPKKKLTENESADLEGNKRKVRSETHNVLRALRDVFGGNSVIAAKILGVAGIGSDLYSNEPDFNGSALDKSKITNADDGKAGGNYSGTGKLSSAAPKQVIVNISNLLEIKTIELLKSPEGSQEEIQNLKEKMAQALIDVVHDFDASWNG